MKMPKDVKYIILKFFGECSDKWYKNNILANNSRTPKLVDPKSANEFKNHILRQRCRRLWASVSSELLSPYFLSRAKDRDTKEFCDQYWHCFPYVA